MARFASRFSAATDDPGRPSLGDHVSGESDQPQPIGGYAAPREGTPGDSSRRFNQNQYGERTGFAPAAPVYFDGDEYRLIRSMSPRQIAQLQTEMAAAGLIGPRTSYIPGNAETTRSEFRDLLAAANGMGVTWRTALRQLAAAGADAADAGLGGDPVGGETRALPTYQAPNRDDVRSAIRRGMYAQFGTHDAGIDVDALTDQYLAMSRSRFDAQVGLAESGGGGQVEDVQSLEGFVEDQARAADPMGVESRDFLDRANAFFGMLSGPVT